MKLTSIEGIGEARGRSLEKAGVRTQDDLLAQGATPTGRKAISRKSGISGKLILGWVNRADLARVSGIGEEYADLLEAAGVDTVPELARRNASNLLAAMTKANAAKRLVRQLPAESAVAGWIEQAKGLPRVITY